MNYAGGLSGLQAAGAVNYVEGDIRLGGQLAGAVNIARGNVRGVQASGAVNVARDLTGAQIGIIYFGRKVKGAQIGVINLSDDLDGVPIGLFSYSCRGRNHVDIWSGELFPANIGLKTGSKYVHGILTVGADPRSERRRWAVGACLGGHISAAPMFNNIDALHYKLNEDEAWAEPMHMGSQLRLIVGWDIHPRLAVMLGTTANVLVLRLHDGSHLCGESFYDTRSGRTWVRIWPGFVAGLQF